MELTIKRVRELSEKATPGPWRFSGRDVVYAGDQNTPILRVDMVPYHPETSVREFHKRANVELAAAAPDLARLALDLHAQLQQERAAREKLEALAAEFFDADQALADVEYKLQLGYRRLSAQMPGAEFPTEAQETEASFRQYLARDALRAALAPAQAEEMTG